MSDDAQYRGGARGVTARYTDMQRSGELLMGMSTMFVDDAATIGRYATDPDVLSSAPFAPVEALRVESRLAGVGIDLAADAVEVGVLGALLVGAVEAYELADRAIAAAADGAARLVGYSVGYALPAVALIGGAQFLQQAGMAWGIDQARGLIDRSYDPRSFGEILGDQGEEALALAGKTGLLEWLEQHPEIIDPLTRGAPGLINGLTSNPIGFFVMSAANGWAGGRPGQGMPLTYEQAVAAILTGGSTFGLFDDGSFTVRPTSEEDDLVLNDNASNRIQHISSIDDTLRSLWEIDEYDQIDYADESNEPDYSRIRVVEVVGGDGVARWIVQIPSTQSWNPSAGPALNDISACLVEMSGEPSALAGAVREAMQQAGIEKGDPVMLTGFSLGGITAGYLASDPSFTNTYDVQAVLTAGSPIARFDIGSDIQVLAVEHYDDFVPHVDGVDNPDLPNWTTVTDTAPIIPNPKKDITRPYIDSQHNALTYAKTAQAAQDSQYMSDGAYARTVAPFFEGSQTIIDFRAERVH